MSESLRNDGRVWVPGERGDSRAPGDIPEAERDYYLERKYPSFGNLAPRDIASRAAKQVCDEGRGVGPTGLGVYLDFRDAIQRLGARDIADRYGNLFEMYQRITDEDPYRVPMRIYPAVHYTMGGLWVDYNLMSTIPGLHVIGEANFSDHGANRLGASALMQGLADGYFILPYTIGDYLASARLRACRRRRARVARDRGRTSRTARSGCWRSGAPHGRLVPSPARPHPVGEVRHGAPRRGAAGGAAGDPGAPGGVLGERHGAGHGRDAQSGPGKSRTRGRLPGAGRAHVPGCAPPHRVLRRAFP